MDLNLAFADKDELDAQQLIFHGIPRQVYERANYLHSFNEKLFHALSFAKNSVLHLLEQIENDLQYPVSINFTLQYVLVIFKKYRALINYK